ncbi:hypothetical protein HKX48_006276 [Thoreauomyces humboldtii]|nr:hypothetical protein HKX48_006276 [Thoreauomyces humboldtii]
MVKPAEEKSVNDSGSEDELLAKRLPPRLANGDGPRPKLSQTQVPVPTKKRKASDISNEHAAASNTTQGSILTYLTTSDPPEPVTVRSLEDRLPPSYFVLDTDQMTATFTTELPRRAAYKARYWWAEQEKTITLCANVPSELAVYDHDQSNYPDRCLQMLCSHLQTCVRSGNVQKSQRTAHELMRLDMLAFLKRLSLVILQDSVPGPQYPVLIWLLCARSKGFRISWRLREWLAGLTGAAAGASFREEDDLPLAPANLAQRIVPETPHAKRDFVFSLQLTKDFQVESVARNIDHVTNAWLKRFKADSRDAVYSRTRYSVAFTGLQDLDLDVDSWDTSAIDPSCSDILDLIRLEFSAQENLRWPTDEVPEQALKKYGRRINRREGIVLCGTERAAGTPGLDSTDETDVFWKKYRSIIPKLQLRTLRATSKIIKH